MTSSTDRQQGCQPNAVLRCIAAFTRAVRRRGSSGWRWCGLPYFCKAYKRSRLAFVTLGTRDLTKALADHVVKEPGVRQLVYPGCEDHPTPDRLSAG